MKINKNYIAASLAFALAACSEQADFTQADVVNAAVENAEVPVQFNTYMGGNSATRAYSKGIIANATDETNGTATGIKEVGIGVFSYYTSTAEGYDRTTPTALKPNFMYNENLTWNTTKGNWVYSPVKYWPNGVDTDNLDDSPSNTAISTTNGKLSFFAYAPYIETPATDITETVNDKVPSALKVSETINAKRIATITDGTSGVVALSTNANEKHVWLKYLMPKASATEAIDLLWGLAGKHTYNETDGVDPSLTVGSDYNVNLTKQAVSEKVTFMFKHALAKIGGATSSTATESTTGNPKQCGLKVVVDVDANQTTTPAPGQSSQTTYFPSDFDNATTLVTLKSVKVRDGASAAGSDGVAAGTLSDLNTFGWFNIETGSWCSEEKTFGHTTGGTYSIEANNENTTLTDEVYLLNEQIKEIGAKKNGASGDGKELASGNNSWSSGMPTGVTLQPKPVFADENVPGLLLIPGGSQTLYITVDYFVRTADSKLDACYTEVEQVITNKVTLTGLDANKYYTLVMHLGLTSVKFEAVVTDWTTNDGDSFNEDGTVNPSGDENGKSVWLPSNVVTANSYTVTAATSNFPAKGGETALTVSLNGATPSYTVDASGTAWLTWEDSKLKASANTTNKSRTANVPVSVTTTGGSTLTYQLLITQAAYGLKLAASGATVTVTDGDDQDVTSGYTVVVSGGDGAGAQTNSGKTITVTGTAGQTYTVTVTHTGSGATAETTVTLPTS